MPKWIRDIGGRLVKCDSPQRRELEVILNIMEATPEDQHSHQEQLVIRPYLVPLLPTFHGMESENPYAHIKEFEDVCNTFQEGGASIDLMRLKLFPFTLKDKAKIWLNSLRSRSIRSWTDLQAEYMEAINACPHHGFDIWLLVSYFYDGMSSSMKQLLETMCGGDFMSKNPEEAMDFLSYVADVSRGWDEPTKGEVGKMKSHYDKKIGELELKRIHEVQAVAETPVQVKLCPNCQSFEHLVEECPAIPTEREMFRDQANAARATQYQQSDPPSQQSSSIEQAIANLSKAYKFEYTARKGRFPSQPHQNPKPTPKPHVEKEEEIKKGKEMENKESEISEEKKESDSTRNAIPEKELLKEKC
ncbi:hypothetical protein CK203_117600 [Vitis vinifera]|uniref:Retrotransposon gag domain-containing protein n=1 Tax=Vitis vinifera TaxID=29760 RepID=A0A438CPN0_VITVI|nr:hypothetical protein CK203_117600 [Vitis vinifera]